MPSPVVVAGLGATITIGANIIAQVVSIDGPSMEFGQVETTNLSSTAKTYRPTLFDGGEINFVIQYDYPTATHTALVGLLASASADAAQTCVLTTADTHTMTFQGFLTKFEPGGMEPEGNLTADCTLKVTGSVTFA